MLSHYRPTLGFVCDHDGGEEMGKRGVCEDSPGRDWWSLRLGP